MTAEEEPVEFATGSQAGFTLGGIASKARWAPPAVALATGLLTHAAGASVTFAASYAAMAAGLAYTVPVVVWLTVVLTILARDYASKAYRYYDTFAVRNLGED